MRNSLAALFLALGLLSSPVRAETAQATNAQSQTAPSQTAPTADEYGLKPGHKVVFSDVVFKVGSSTLDPKGFEPLDKLGAYLAARPDLAIEISGHADALGKAEANQKLSQKRAEAVKGYLVKKYKLKTGQIIPKGYGSTKPLAENDTDENRAKNRRIEVVAISADTGEVVTAEAATSQFRARITAVAQPVSVKAPWDDKAEQAHLNAPVFGREHVDVGDNGRAELTFSPNNRVQLFGNTNTVVDSGPRATRPKNATSETTLSNGTLLTKLDDLKDKEQFIVATPLCSVQTGPRTEVTANAERTTVSARKGPASVVVNGKTVVVPEGKGVVVTKGKVEGPFDLPAAATLTSPANGSDISSEAETKLAWTSGNKSTADVATDSEANMPVAVKTEGTSANQIFAPGKYYWSVRTEDARGLSQQSETWSFAAQKPLPPPPPAPVAAAKPTAPQAGKLTATSEPGAEEGQAVVSGQVEPATAEVTVDGTPASVKDGKFQHTAQVGAEPRDVTVLAKQEGYTFAPVTFKAEPKTAEKKPSSGWVGLGAEGLIAVNYRDRQMAGIAGRLRITKLFGDHIGLTGSMRFGVMATHRGNGGPHAVVGADLGGVYEFTKEGRFVPFAELTIGAFGYGPAEDHPGRSYDRSQLSFAPRAGLGVRFGKHGFAPAVGAGYRILVDMLDTPNKGRIHSIVDVSLSMEINLP